MLPRLSKVSDHGEWIFFFVEVERTVMYAVTESDNEFWWTEFIEPWKTNNKESES